MIYTGVVVLAFLVYHVLTFKYGPGVDEGYVMTIDGVAVRDLYRLVVETFAQLPYTIIYVAVMALLGFHLRHGFWSAFQSLGMNHPRYTPIIYGIALLFAVVMAVGFLIIPVAVYLRGGAA
jgi:succinate dehydrogenase / fumarate reductase cytochrome b subunit